jgi:mannosyl-3-phosphoglycerate phosphatase
VTVSDLNGRCSPAAWPLSVVFTDVDGCLLDHHTYCVDDAAEAVDLLVDRGVPLVLCSSKTGAELEDLTQALGIRHPFISENGGALFIPAGYFPFLVPGSQPRLRHHIMHLGAPYPEVIEVLHRVARESGVAVAGFNEMSVEEVARDCRLLPSQARLAKQREHDEPFRVLDPEPAARVRLRRALADAGLWCASGGRYEHVVGGTHKGVAVSFLAALYRQAFGRTVTIGLGDSLNDVPMLQEVDIPIVIRNAALGPAMTTRILQQVPTAWAPGREGPAGWRDVLIGLLGRRPSRVAAAWPGSGGWDGPDA